MNEREWSVCGDPTLMLNHVRDRVSNRRLRLFAVACSRSIWRLLPDERSRAAVEVAERYADGLASPRELARAKAVALTPADRRAGRAAWAAYWSVSPNVAESIWNAREAAVEGTAQAAVRSARGAGADQAAAWDAARTAEGEQQARFLRDIIGNPFRPVASDPSWRTRASTAIAQLIYDELDFGLLPVLADALEDAGCENGEVLNHCRLPGGHVRGCWVVDLILGKG
jgi:hypothetical protein